MAASTRSFGEPCDPRPAGLSEARRRAAEDFEFRCENLDRRGAFAMLEALPLLLDQRQEHVRALASAFHQSFGGPEADAALAQALARAAELVEASRPADLQLFVEAACLGVAGSASSASAVSEAPFPPAASSAASVAESFFNLRRDACRPGFDRTLGFEILRAAARGLDADAFAERLALHRKAFPEHPASGFLRGWPEALSGLLAEAADSWISRSRESSSDPQVAEAFACLLSSAFDAEPESILWTDPARDAEPPIPGLPGFLWPLFESPLRLPAGAAFAALVAQAPQPAVDALLQAFEDGSAPAGSYPRSSVRTSRTAELQALLPLLRSEAERRSLLEASASASAPRRLRV